MIDVEPRDARWWVMAEDDYRKHAGVQGTTTTDTSSSSSNKIHALITITDTECGISPSFLSTKMFQTIFSRKFFTGWYKIIQIRLSIVKLLVEKMGDLDQANEEIRRDIKNDDLGDFNSLDSFNENDNLIKDFEEKQRKIILIILEEVKQKKIGS
ncbi:unnamed protein product [Rhizophagus irregularis]|nr:unnamed protein product [Rhizophagus irregularis]